MVHGNALKIAVFKSNETINDQDSFSTLSNTFKITQSKNSNNKDKFRELSQKNDF